MRSASRRRRTNQALDIYEESIDSLRACLILPREHRELQILGVASSVPGEGKTSVATQLAVSIARSTGHRTLLVDADLRSPDVHNVFHLANEPGLAKVLDGAALLDDAIDTSWSPTVHVLPAGQLHKSPHELFGNGRWRSLLEDLRPRYEHIIIDTPPVLAASEALAIGSQADATVFCVLRERSREDQIKLAYKRLTAAGGKVLGVVLNAVPAHHYEFRYGSYSYQRNQQTA
jgi:capsular exopolysaccharide synthesis family protein